MRERRSKSLGLLRHVGPRWQAHGEEALVVGRQLAAERAAGDGGGEAIELIEEARDGIGALWVELDGLVRSRSEEEEPQLLGRQYLRHLMRRSAAAARRAHLLTADVQELVVDAQRWFALEDLSRDGVGAVSRATGGREVLPTRLDRHAQRRGLLAQPSPLERAHQASSFRRLSSGRENRRLRPRPSSRLPCRRRMAAPRERTQPRRGEVLSHTADQMHRQLS